jgi:aldehyde dehydrogenase (NAD+)
MIRANSAPSRNYNKIQLFTIGQNKKLNRQNSVNEPYKSSIDVIDTTCQQGALQYLFSAYDSNGKVSSDQIIVSKKDSNYASKKMEYLNGQDLLNAASKGDLPTVQHTLVNGAKVNFQGQHEFTALHLASRAGHIEIMQYLLQLGAEIEAQNKNGNTPMHSAAYGDQIAAILTLLDNGAYLEATNKNGDTPMHSAAWKNNYAAIEVLSAKLGNLEAINHDGDTPLHLAAWNNCVLAIETLINQNANLNVINKDGNTPLDLARQKNNKLAQGAIMKASALNIKQVKIQNDLIIKNIHSVASELSQRILKKRANLKLILSDYQLQNVSDYEIERSLRTLVCLKANNEHLDVEHKIDSIAVMLPSNLALYSLVIFAIIPSFLSKNVNVRPNTLLQEQSIINRIFYELELENLFPKINIINSDHAGFKKYITEADLTIFTGKSSKANDLAKDMKENAILIVNGSGHNPVVVTDSANIDEAVKGAVLLKSFNGGQDCAGPDAILLHENIAAEFISKFQSQFSDLKRGNFKDPNAIIGPISRFSELHKFAKLFHENSRDIISGGTIDFKNNIVSPTTIIRNIERYPNHQEMFGPVAFIHPYKEDQDLEHYFQDIHRRYNANRMYVTVYGHSNYISDKDDSQNPRENGNVGIVLYNKTIHDIEIGYKPYGGYSLAASGVIKKLPNHETERIGMPILIPEIITKYIIKGKALPSTKEPTLPFAMPIAVKRGKEINPVVLSFQDLAINIFDSNIAFGFIFGSAAKGQLKVLGHDISDLDTFICLKENDQKAINKYIDRLSLLHDKYNLKVDQKFPAEIMTLAKLENSLAKLGNIKISINKVIKGEEFDDMFWAHSLTDKKIGFIGDGPLMSSLIKKTIPYIYEWSSQIIEQLKFQNTLPKHLSKKFLGLTKDEAIAKLSGYNAHMIVHLGLNYDDHSE